MKTIFKKTSVIILLLIVPLGMFSREACPAIAESCKTPESMSGLVLSVSNTIRRWDKLKNMMSKTHKSKDVIESVVFTYGQLGRSYATFKIRGVFASKEETNGLNLDSKKGPVEFVLEKDDISPPPPALSYKEPANTGSEKIASGVNSTSYVAENLTPATSYYFAIYTANADATSVDSLSGDAYTTPAVTADLQATTTSASVALTWSYPSGAGTPDKFEIYRSAAGGTDSSKDGGGTKIHTTSNGTAISYTDSGLETGTSYSYSVYAVNGPNDSLVYSAPVSETFKKKLPKLKEIEISFKNYASSYLILEDIQLYSADGKELERKNFLIINDDGTHGGTLNSYDSSYRETDYGSFSVRAEAVAGIYGKNYITKMSFMSRDATEHGTLYINYIKMTYEDNSARKYQISSPFKGASEIDFTEISEDKIEDTPAP